MTQSAELNIQVVTPRSMLYVPHNSLTLWKVLNKLAQIITIVRQCAYDMHGTASMSLLVKGQ
jgi:hypothetical protein